MSDSIKTDDVIFNFFKQICDEKDELKCVELGNGWINAMETNLDAMIANLSDADMLKHKPFAASREREQPRAHALRAREVDAGAVVENNLHHVVRKGVDDGGRRPGRQGAGVSVHGL